MKSRLQDFLQSIKSLFVFVNEYWNECLDQPHPNPSRQVMQVRVKCSLHDLPGFGESFPQLVVFIKLWNSNFIKKEHTNWSRKVVEPFVSTLEELTVVSEPCHS
jgi:hypothetical protein